MQSPIPVLTGLDVEQLRWSRSTRYRYTKPPTCVCVCCYSRSADQSTSTSTGSRPTHCMQRCLSDCRLTTLSSILAALARPAFHRESSSSLRLFWVLFSVYRLTSPHPVSRLTRLYDWDGVSTASDDPTALKFRTMAGMQFSGMMRGGCESWTFLAPAHPFLQFRDYRASLLLFIV